MTSAQQLKPFSEVPGPRGLPLIGTLWDFAKPNGFGFNKMFEVLDAFDSFDHYHFTVVHVSNIYRLLPSLQWIMRV